MAKITKMLSTIFLCFILLSSTHGEDHWKEQLKQRLVRAVETNPSSWLRRTTKPTTTTTITTTTTTTTKPTSITTTATTTKPTTTPATTSSSSTFTTFQNEALAQTNKYRAIHCAPNLILSPTLNAIAQAYAVKLVSIGSLVHSGNGYGENLYSMWSSRPIDLHSFKGSVAIDSWYSEVNQYNWTSPGFSYTTGHFTQLVWIATQQFGTGIACTTDKTSCYVVTNYSPRGNYANQYQANVKPPTCA